MANPSKDCEDRKQVPPEKEVRWPPEYWDPRVSFDPFIAPAYGGPTEQAFGFSRLQIAVDTAYSSWLMLNALRVAVRV